MKGERFGMNDFNMVLINRKQLYDEIWKISVAGVAKKYNLHYAKLIKSLKSYDIPYPSSGYWTRLACGKDVSGEIKPLPQKILMIFICIQQIILLLKNINKKMIIKMAVRKNKNQIYKIKSP